MNRETRFFRLSLVEFAVVGGLFLLSLGVFVAIADLVVINNKDLFDTMVFHAVSTLTSPAMTAVAVFISFFGSQYFLFPAYLVLIIFSLVRHRRQQALLLFIFASISNLSVVGLKIYFHRARPLSPLVTGVGGFSFPSGHSLGAFTFSGMLVYLIGQSDFSPSIKRAGSVLAVFFAALIALSRIYLRVHYPSDVLAGALLTLVWLSLAFVVIRRLQNELPVTE